MTVSIAVVGFEASGSSGTQDITSSGFGTPKAVLFFYTRKTTTYSGTANASQSLFGMGCVDGTNEWACGAYSQDNQGTSNTGRRGDTATCIQIINPWDAGINGEASFDSFITDGVRIDWTNATSTDFKITAVLFGGDGLSAYAGTDNVNESVGTAVNIDTGTVEPNLLILGSHRDSFDDTAKAHSSFTIGFATTQAIGLNFAQTSLNVAAGDGAGTTANQGQLYFGTSVRRILKNNSAADGDAAGLEITDWSPGGNATSFEATQRDATGRIDFGFLALDLADGTVGTILGANTTPTATGDVDVTGVGGELIGALRILSHMTTVDGTVDSAGGGGVVGLGATDGTNGYAAVATDEDNVGTSNSASYHYDGFTLAPGHDRSSSDDVIGDIDSVNGDGWVESYTQVDTGQVYYVPTLAIFAGNNAVARASVDVVGAVTPAEPVKAAQAGAPGSISASAGSDFPIKFPRALNGGFTAEQAFSAGDVDLAPSLAGAFAAAQAFAAGELDRLPALAGGFLAQQAFAGTVTQTMAVVGSFLSESTFAGGELDLRQALAGAFEGEQAFAGALDATLALAGAFEAGQAFGDAELQFLLDLAGSFAGEASFAAGELDTRPGLAGGFTASAAFSGALGVVLELTGAFTAEQTVDADELDLRQSLAGGWLGESVFAGSLDLPGVLVELEGSFAGHAAFAGTLTQLVGLAGAFVAEQTVAGTLTQTMGLSGAFVGEQSFAAALDVSMALVGVFLAESAFAGDLDIGEQLLLAGGFSAESAFAATLIFCSDVVRDPAELDGVLVPKALELLERLGSVASFHVLASEAYDPATGENTQTLDAIRTARVTPPFPIGSRLEGLDIVKSGEGVCFMQATSLTFTPEIGQRVEIDGQSWQITRVGPVYTGEQVALWAISLRGGDGDFAASTLETALDQTLSVSVPKLIAALGKTFTFETATLTYDPTTGEVVESGAASETIKGTPPDRFRTTIGAGGDSSTGSCRTFLDASTLTFDLELAMPVTFDGREHRVVGIRPVRSGYRVVLWELELRGGVDETHTAAALETRLDVHLVAKALTLVNRFGKVALFYPPAPAGTNYDPATGLNHPEGQDAPPEKKITPPQTVSLGAAQGRFSDGITGDDGPQRGVAITYVPAAGTPLTPVLGMRVLLDCELWRVIGVRPHYSGEQVVLWELGLRR